MYMWQLGRTTKSHCAERWGAKEERVHYLSRQLLPLVRRHDVIIARHNSRNTLLPGPTGNQSHLGHLDFLSERHGDGANFCVFIAEKDGESE